MYTTWLDVYNMARCIYGKVYTTWLDVYNMAMMSCRFAPGDRFIGEREGCKMRERTEAKDTHVGTKTLACFSFWAK
jgi:hypothetical protein